MTVVGPYSESPTSNSDLLTGSKVVEEDWQQGGWKDNIATLTALEKEAKRTKHRTVVLMCRGQVCFVTPTLAALTAGCQQEWERGEIVISDLWCPSPCCCVDFCVLQKPGACAAHRGAWQWVLCLCKDTAISGSHELARFSEYLDISLNV